MMLKPDASVDPDLRLPSGREETLPDVSTESIGFSAPRPGVLRALAITLLVCLASASMLPVWAAAWYTWSSDPLRSIGIVFPLLSLAGVLAAWRTLRWRLQRSWWGLALLVLAIAGARVFSEPLLIGYVFGQPLRPLHPGMALFCYGVGAVLLFGDAPLLRRALAPLALLLLVDPVPHAFNQHFDLPLQFLSATTARAFAHATGLQPTGEQLQMMFAPRFGVFIAPGCNGIRGAVTLGYLALIFGYVRRLPLKTLAIFTVAAVALGYVFNLVRLCVLVVYYRVGMAHPAMQPYGTEVDYVIGCTMFLVATLGVGCGITLYQVRRGLDTPFEQPTAVAAELPAANCVSAIPGAILLAALAIGFFVPRARSAAFAPRLTESEALRALPPLVGPYTLVDTRREVGGDGSINFVFGEYVRQGSGEHLQVGIYLLNEDHLVSLSKRAQGIVPENSGSMDAFAAGGVPVHLLTSFYHDGASRTFDAETSCRPTVCDERVVGDQSRTALIFPHFADLFNAPEGRRVPVVLRKEWVGSQESSEELSARFHGSAREFLHDFSVAPLFPSGH